MIDIGAHARRAHRLFVASQILFVIGAVVLLSTASYITSGKADLDSGLPGRVAVLCLFSALLIHVVVMAVGDYQAWFWRACEVASILVLTSAVIAIPLAIAHERIDDAVSYTIFGVVILFSTIWFVRKLYTARMLLNAHLHAFDDRLVRVMAKVTEVWKAQRAEGHGVKLNGGLGQIMVIVSTTAIAVIAIGILTAQIDTNRVVLNALGELPARGIMTLPIWGIMLAFGRRLAQPAAHRLLEADQRDPVLLLRSFEDDQARLTSTNIFSRLLYLGFFRQIRLEYAISDELNRIGPFIAVGQPGEKLPDLGAARAYLDDDKWQAQVLEWIAKSRLIVVVGGRSHWVGWEMKQVAAGGRLHHLILLLPPRTKHDGEQHAERWARVVDSFADTPWGAVLTQLDGQQIIGLVGTPEGRLLAFRSDKPTQADYELVVRLATYAQFRSSVAVR